KLLLRRMGRAPAGQGDALSCYNAGMYWLERARYDRALVGFNEAIAMDPRNGLFYYGRSSALSGQGEHDKAREDLTEAIHLFDERIQHNRNDALAFLHRGMALWEEGLLAWPGNDENRAKAISDFNEAIRLAPYNHEAYIERGKARLEEDEDGIIRDFDNAL